LQESGYFGLMEKSYPEQSELLERKEIAEELLRGLETYQHKNARRKPSLAGFLQELTMEKTDEDEQREGANLVQLMTIHKAKGLEFGCVFVCGLDDAIVPSPRSVEEGNIEEERRLFYVAMTRAKKLLILTYPHTRVFRNKEIKVTPSRFLREIPEEFLESPLGKREDEDKAQFMDDFFKQMKEKLGAGAK
jgi:DNA helicase II / ATP-dependent DNA helicase PcrA